MVMKRTRKALLSLLLLGAVGSVAGFGTWSAFTATTTNTGNSYTAGSVQISQHAGATTLYTGAHQSPSATTTGCVRVTYGATLPATVKLYASSITNGSSFHLKVERGSGLTTLDNTMSCAGFTAASTAFDADMSTVPTTYAAGIDGKAAAAAWAQNDSIDYRFTITVIDDSTPNAHTTELGTGTHSFTWEARSN
jgi:predicted ribosomally synthesized peptide with SipW-like signal peptide